jgi:cytochrome oxidase assembly protein ShyY1
LNVIKALILERRVATVAMLIVVAIGLLAGRWQLSRAEQKITLTNQIAAMASKEQIDLNAKFWNLSEVEFRPVRAKGTFIPNQTVWLDNRPKPNNNQQGQTQSGFYVLMPFLLEGLEKRVVWVNRGWAPRNNQDRLVLPSISTPSGVVLIEGIALASPGRVLELGNQPNSIGSPRIQQNLDLAYEAKQLSYPQLPFVIRQNDPDERDGLSRIWPAATTGVDRHYAYAFQWFSLAAATLAFWLTTGLIRYRNQRKQDS